VTTLWLTISGCCIAVAAILMFRGNFDVAFVVAVVGMIAWFLNYRAQVQKSLTAEDTTAKEENETDRDED
jgi:hypothetical protein